MRSSKPSARRFNAYSDRGFVDPPKPRFTSSFVRELGGAYVRVSDNDVVLEALRIVAEWVPRHSALSNPRITREYLALRFAGLEHEVFACIYLDNRHRPIACEELFRGTIDGASVHPREVVKRALVHNAAAVILAHNHPSGVAEPSQADELITRRLKEALALVDIRVLDHVVVGSGHALSMAERGLI
jgi:DNA repair protein RadC